MATNRTIYIRRRNRIFGMKRVWNDDDGYLTADRRRYEEDEKRKRAGRILALGFRARVRVRLGSLWFRFPSPHPH